MNITRCIVNKNKLNKIQTNIDYYKNMLKEWRWSNGESYLKSARKIKELNNINIQEEQQEQQINNDTNMDPNSAINQSLEGFDSFLFDTKFSRNDNDLGNRREDLDHKISDREHIFQRGTNPFLQNVDYVKDIVTRDRFLKPQNTTFDKIKNDEKENNVEQ